MLIVEHHVIEVAELESGEIGLPGTIDVHVVELAVTADRGVDALDACSCVALDLGHSYHEEHHIVSRVNYDQI